MIQAIMQTKTTSSNARDKADKLALVAEAADPVTKQIKVEQPNAEDNYLTGNDLAALEKTASDVAALARPLPAHLMHYAEVRVPRYTSYPTAPQFSEAVGPDTYYQWLGALTQQDRLSLYLHIPFCSQLCWYCGCNTQVAANSDRVAGYADLVTEEIALVFRALNEQAQGVGPVSHLHLGGGSPNMLAPADLVSILRCLQLGFDFEEGAEIACEVDPRDLTDCFISGLAVGGMNRVSLGVQDLNPAIQKRINRVQPLGLITDAVNRLRRAGINAINLDLMYGLPGQTVGDVLNTIDQVLPLQPARLAVFGYAHVPW
ncbi:MAG: radical SAM protein, partial [Pseudomonadota bacterium]